MEVWTWGGRGQPNQAQIPSLQDRMGAGRKGEQPFWVGASRPLTPCPIQAVITRQSQSGPEIPGVTEGHGLPDAPVMPPGQTPSGHLTD